MNLTRLWRREKTRETEANAALLDASIRDWRSAAEPKSQTLSDARVARILRATRTDDAGEAWLAPLASLFVPARRIAWAAGMPSVALLLVVASFMYQSGTVVPATSPLAAATLSVSRIGDEVVFEISNGGRSHRVYRADSPEGLASAESDEAFALAQGSFRDRLASDSEIVFYRVD